MEIEVTRSCQKFGVPRTPIIIQFTAWLVIDGSRITNSTATTLIENLPSDNEINLKQIINKDSMKQIGKKSSILNVDERSPVPPLTNMHAD